MTDMSEPPVSLEDLLKLKRHESPQDGFWSDFERDFQRRRLRALMDGDADAPRWGFWKQALLWGPVSTGAVAALAFFALSAPDALIQTDEAAGGEPELASAPVKLQVLPESRPVESGRPALLTSVESLQVHRGQSRFVFDALASDEEPGSFRRVLSNASLSVPTTAGSRYVADPLTAGRADAIPAAYQPRAHF